MRGSYTKSINEHAACRAYSAGTLKNFSKVMVKCPLREESAAYVVLRAPLLACRNSARQRDAQELPTLAVTIGNHNPHTATKPLQIHFNSVPH